jgi:hypothetical protein
LTQALGLQVFDEGKQHFGVPENRLGTLAFGSVADFEATN